MRILLPPSETKHPGGSGTPLGNAGATGGPADDPLTTTRRTVLDAVRRLCTEHPERAVELLRIPPAVAETALATNREVFDAPTMPALDRFTGVLFDAFAPATLTPAARRRADEMVLVFDGAFGVLRGDEPTPDHRVPAAATLPELGGLAAVWRPVLAEVLRERLDGHLVVDLRSTDYAAMWRPVATDASCVVPVRILVEQRTAAGTKQVVSSVPSKVGKGLLARALCTTRRQVRNERDLRAVATAAGFRIATGSQAGALDLLFDFVPKAARGRSG